MVTQSHIIVFALGIAFAMFALPWLLSMVSGMGGGSKA
jgi:hypothetical protein